MSDSTEESLIPSTDHPNAALATTSADIAAEAGSAESQPGEKVPMEEVPVEAAVGLVAGGDREAAGGPLSLEKIRQLRMSQQATAPQRPPKQSRPVGSPAPRGDSQASSGDAVETATKPDRGSKFAKDSRRGRGDTVIQTPEPLSTQSKIAIPSIRQPLSADLEQELNAALGLSDLEKLLVGDSMLQVGHELTEGQRIQATVMKAHGEFVFVSLGGPNEGVIPSISFETLPEVGAQLDIVVRGYLAQEGLYEVTVPGNTVSVSDWDDLNEGEVIEVVVTAANAGGLECKVGNIQGFIPASQAAEYRIETLGDFVGQKLLCVVTEANPRRGNLVLSHRAVLEREKKEKREERLANLEIGSAVEGVVRKILDFGAFVDIGGIDGLLHISQLSWERVKHPSEILEEGQKIQVRVDKIDEQTGKIGLSYRSLQEHPWENIDARFPPGAVVRGSVTRIAEFGAFVRIATGVEGLVHVSELAHHRVQNVGNVVQEGQEIDVKVLSVDPDQQRISLSLKAAQAAPEPVEAAAASEDAVEEPRPQPVLPKHRGPLKGGTGKNNGGEQFGLKW